MRKSAAPPPPKKAPTNTKQKEPPQPTQSQPDQNKAADDNNPNKELLSAVGDTDHKAVKKILSKVRLDSAIFEYRNNGGNTPLILAAQRLKERDSYELTKAILDCKIADINAQNKQGISALMGAAKKGYSTVVELLLSAGAEFELKDEEGKVAYDLTTDKGCSRALKDAFKARRSAERAAKVSSDATELIELIVNGQIDKAIAFVNSAKYFDVFTYSPDLTTPSALSLAVDNKFVELTRSMVKANAQLNRQDKRGRTLCMRVILMPRLPSFPTTARSREQEAVRLDLLSALLESEDTDHLDLYDNDGFTALMHAAIQGYDEDIRRILQLNTVKINLKQKSNAKYRGTKEGIREKLADSALLLAARRGNLDAMKCLIEFNADIDIQGADDMTALMWCAYHGRTEQCLYLRSVGADPNLQSAFGETALTWCMERGHLKTAKALLQQDFPDFVDPPEGEELSEAEVLRRAEFAKIVPIDANVVTKNGANALQILCRKCASWDHEDVLDLLNLLFRKRINVNQRSWEGLTAVMWTVTNKDLKLTKALLEHGANPKIKDVNRLNAIDKATDMSMRLMLSEAGNMFPG